MKTNKVSVSFTVSALVIAVFSISFSASATGPLTLGLKGGLAYSTMATSNLDGSVLGGTNYSNGWVAGLGLDFDGGLPISIEADLLYAMRSYGFAGSTVRTLNRVEIPVQAVCTIGKVVALSGGVYYARGVGSVKESINSTVPVPVVASSSSDISAADWGLVFGIGFRAPAAVLNFGVDLRYSIGFSNLAVNPSGSQAEKNRTLDLVASLFF